MKKIIKLLLTLVVLIGLTSCSSNSEKNEVASLYEQGYEQTMTSLTDNKWLALFEKDYSYNDAYKVEITMDQATYDKLIEIDTTEDEGFNKFREIIEYLPNCTITSLNDELPSENDFDKYIGKTIADLESDGYERSGYTYDETGCIFYADGPKYSVNVQTNEVITYETIDDYSENDIRALTIKSIEFTGFSYLYFN